MNFVRTFSILTTVAATAMVTSAWAASAEQHDSHHPAATASIEVAQASPTTPGMGMGAGMGMAGNTAMPGYAEQMKSMQAIHDKMVAAKTPEERNALMTEQMKIMQSGMGMMGRMGLNAMPGKPGDMTSRQSMMEQRMDMMQSMMQMMMDRMPPAPATK